MPKTSRRPRTERRLPYIYLAPSLLVLCVFGVLPVLFTVAMSFFRWDAIKGLSDATFDGLGNFAWIFVADDWFGHSLINTLWHTAVAGMFIHGAAIPLAVFINQAFRRWRSTVLALYFLPYITAGIVVYVIFSTLFSASEAGLANAALMALGNIELFGLRPFTLFFPTEPIEWFRLHGDALGVMGAFWGQLGWNVLLYVTAMQYVPKVLLEAARIDGATPWQALRYVIVPALRPMIFFAGSLTVVAAFANAGPYSLSGYLQYLAYNVGDYGAAAAGAVIVLLVLTGAIYLLWAHIGGRPALPRETTSRVGNDDAVRVTMRARLWRELRARLAAPKSHDPRALLGFNGMRAIACLMIIVHHCTQRLDGEWSLIWLIKPLWYLGLRTDMGVCIFFVLSGALLSTPFWQRYLDGQAPPRLWHYTVRRAARILPGYWVALGVTALIGLTAIPEAQYVLRRFVAGLTFTSALHYTTFFPTELDPVLWSISLEVMCYVLLPLLILPLWRVLPKRTPENAMRYAAWVLIGLTVAHLAIVANFMTSKEGKGWHLGLIGGAKEWLPYWSPASFMTQFMLGGVAALGIAWRRRVKPTHSTELERLGVIALLVAWALYALFGSGVNTVTRQPYITPIFPALLAFALFAMQFGDRLHRWLDNRLFNWVATRSFGLYLWHFPIMELIRVYFVPLYKPFELRSIGTWILLCTFVVVSATLLAELSWRVIEQPALLWAKRRLAREVTK